MAAALQDVFPVSTIPQKTAWASDASFAVFDPSTIAVDRLSKALVELAKLPKNWDSYGAPQISRDAIDSAHEALFELLATGATMPHLVPTPRGGVQAEWHAGDKSLEIEFISPIQMDFYYEDEGQGIVEEQTLSFDLSPLYMKIAEF